MEQNTSIKSREERGTAPQQIQKYVLKAGRFALVADKNVIYAVQLHI